MIGQGADSEEDSGGLDIDGDPMPSSDWSDDGCVVHESDVVEDADTFADGSAVSTEALIPFGKENEDTNQRFCPYRLYSALFYGPKRLRRIVGKHLDGIHRVLMAQTASVLENGRFGLCSCPEFCEEERREGCEAVICMDSAVLAGEVMGSRMMRLSDVISLADIEDNVRVGGEGEAMAELVRNDVVFSVLPTGRPFSVEMADDGASAEFDVIDWCIGIHRRAIIAARRQWREASKDDSAVPFRAPRPAMVLISGNPLDIFQNSKSVLSAGHFSVEPLRSSRIGFHQSKQTQFSKFLIRTTLFNALSACQMRDSAAADGGGDESASCLFYAPFIRVFRRSEVAAFGFNEEWAPAVTISRVSNEPIAEKSDVLTAALGVGLSVFTPISELVMQVAEEVDAWRRQFALIFETDTQPNEILRLAFEVRPTLLQSHGGQFPLLTLNEASFEQYVVLVYSGCVSASTQGFSHLVIPDLFFDSEIRLDGQGSDGSTTRVLCGLCLVAIWKMIVSIYFADSFKSISFSVCPSATQSVDVCVVLRLMIDDVMNAPLQEESSELVRTRIGAILNEIVFGIDSESGEDDGAQLKLVSTASDLVDASQAHFLDATDNVADAKAMLKGLQNPSDEGESSGEAGSRRLRVALSTESPKPSPPPKRLHIVKLIPRNPSPSPSEQPETRSYVQTTPAAEEYRRRVAARQKRLSIIRTRRRRQIKELRRLEARVEEERATEERLLAAKRRIVGGLMQLTASCEQISLSGTREVMGDEK